MCGDAPNATWKKPLREFLNALSISIDIIFESFLDDLIEDVWALRDEYIDAIIGKQDLTTIIQKHAVGPMEKLEQKSVELLLSAEFERLRMLSSDAWFFYDLDRIEPLNALKYAAHATYLTKLACGRNVSEELLPIISRAHSQNSGLHGDMAFLSYYSRFELNYS